MSNTCQIWEKASSGQLMSQGHWNQWTPKFKIFFKDGEHSKFSASIPENLGQRCIWKLQLWNFSMVKEPNGEFIGNIRNVRIFLTFWQKKIFFLENGNGTIWMILLRMAMLKSTEMFSIPRGSILRLCYLVLPPRNSTGMAR